MAEYAKPGRRAAKRGPGGTPGSPFDVRPFRPAPRPSVRAAAPAIVQRRTGYEAEARIPIYGESLQDAEAIQLTDGFSKKLEPFLFGGLSYGARYGEEPMGHFTISADHNEILAAHQEILDLLRLTGYLHPGADVTSMSSIEYITPARDETGPSGQALMQQDVQEVEAHAGTSYELAKADNVSPLPFTQDQVLTGVPRKELRQWVEAHKGDWNLFEPAVARLESTISDQLYLQQTTGVLPSDLPAFFGKAAQRLTEGGDKWGKVIAHALEVSLGLAQNAWKKAFSEEVPEAFAKHQSAVLGYLAHIGNYLMADSLSLTTFVGDNSTEKNLFAFLPRASLYQSFSALPAEVRIEKDAWLSLLDPLLAGAQDFGSSYWQQYDWLRSRPKATSTSVFQEGEAEDESDNEDEKSPKKPDDRENTRKVLIQLFKGEDPHESFQRPLPELDQPHEEVEKATGEKGIAFEDRYFQEKLKEPTTLKNLNQAVGFTFQESQERLLAHVPKLAKGISQESSQPPVPKLALSGRIEELEVRVAAWPQTIEKGLIQQKDELLKLITKEEEAQQKVKDLRKQVEEYQPIPKPKRDEIDEIDDDLSGSEEDDTLYQLEDALSTAEIDVSTYGEIIVEQGEKIQAVGKLLQTVVELAKSATDSKEKEAKVHLGALSALELQIQHLTLKTGRSMLKPVLDGSAFGKSAARTILNAPEVAVARKKKSEIKTEEMELEAGQQATELLQKADKEYEIFENIKKLRAKSVKPEETTRLLRVIREAGSEFAKLVAEAWNLYQTHKKKTI